MKKLSIIGAAVMGLAFAFSTSADAGGSPPRERPKSNHESTSKAKRTKPKKVLKNIPQATIDAGRIAQERRGRAEHLPDPKPKARPSARGVTILLPDATKPVRPGQKEAARSVSIMLPGATEPVRPGRAGTAAEVVAAHRAARPTNIIPLRSRSGRRLGFTLEGTRPAAVRLNGPPPGLPGERSSTSNRASVELPRLRRDANGRLIDRGSPSKKPK